MGAAALPFAAIAVLLGPQMLRNDLRQDLARLPLLKTWPVSGAALIRGEVLAPTVVATSFAWLACSRLRARRGRAGRRRRELPS